MRENELQTHHISYDPEVTVDLPRDLHIEIHRHGTGPPKGGKKEEEFVLGKRKVLKIGSSYYLPLPTYWLKRYKYPSSLLVFVGNHLLIINPESESDFCQLVEDLIHRPLGGN